MVSGNLVSKFVYANFRDLTFLVVYMCMGEAYIFCSENIKITDDMVTYRLRTGAC
jgi:hypothetical protein